MAETVLQSSHYGSPNSGSPDRIYVPMLGIILAVYGPDHPLNISSRNVPMQNASTATSKSPIGIGSRSEARVLILNDGQNHVIDLPNVVITPNSNSGIDDFSEDLPNGCSFMIDGSRFDQSLIGLDKEKLDGDYCVVDFIGGRINQPFISRWWPHPGNRIDPATSDVQDNKILKQGRRSFKRYQGVKLTITSEGNLFIDTTEAGFDVIGSDKGLKRIKQVNGGDVSVSIKKERKLDINFNPPVQITSDQPGVEPPVTQDGLPVSNPPGTADGVRDDTLSRFTMDQNLVELIAGEVLKLLSRTDNIQVIAQKVAQIVGTDGGVELGGMNLSAQQGTLNGEAKDMFTGLTHFILGNASTVVKNVK